MPYRGHRTPAEPSPPHDSTQAQHPGGGYILIVATFVTLLLFFTSLWQKTGPAMLDHHDD
eukprot:CAMPEP_0174231060 /NCGR_PEP_ID=MMETSP0417-20130205/1682_1 /TAXON_ID=242541 /ORGANISM="Mayorella sp, Strain BSH-02190019" /LENGTH=59 /DNA_ID=CAMNT_0015308867 /DNA_START=606 /DNA_END=782 /DNA_ORIENTATION=+